jgi:hypothetical protein
MNWSLDEGLVGTLDLESGNRCEHDSIPPSQPSCIALKLICQGQHSSIG